MKPLIVMAWAAWSVFLLAAESLAVFLVPIAVLFTDGGGRLPRWARWMETMDAPGWAGPPSEGYPATHWGLIRWLWRNRCYRLSNVWRCSPDYSTMRLAERGTRNPRHSAPGRDHGRAARRLEAASVFRWCAS